MASFGTAILPTSTSVLVPTYTFTPWPPWAIGEALLSTELDDIDTGAPPPTGQLWPRPQGA